MKERIRNIRRGAVRIAVWPLGMLAVTWLAIETASAADGEQNDARAFVTYGCHQCHGYMGQGGLLSGPRIVPSELSFEAFAEVVRRPYGVMPAYAPDVLDQRTLRDIYHDLQSITPTKQ
ncbi:MAG: cytochrome c [Halioglobus sp.]|nr:cytochrome c [Halioglobus sp.]